METLNNIFLPYKIAVQLKGIGFDEPCMSFYYNEELIIDLQENENSNAYLLADAEFSNHNKHSDCYSAPTWEQVFKWFREKGLFGSVEHTYNVKEYSFHWLIVNDNKLVFYKDDIHQAQEIFDLTETFKTHEQAREQLILKLIEIYKDEKN